jgi:hypothetical protein
MKTATMVFLVLTGGGWLTAQANSDRSLNDERGQVSVEGCVSRSSGDYVLMQLDPGNSYVLHSAHNIKLAPSLGEQVRVVGVESPTLSDTSDAGRSAPPITITLNSMSTISKECKL